MTDDLAEIERIAGALLRSLSSGQRRTLMRRMGRDLAAGQRARIAKAERARFMQQSQPLMARMDQERSTLLASAKR